MQSAQENRVFYNPEGYVEAQLFGSQTDIGFKKLYDDCQPLIEQLKAEHKSLLGLIDMSNEVSYSLSSNKAALELLEQLEYEKLAFCNAPHAEVTKGIILALGRSDSTKFFDDRQEAVTWLLAKDQTSNQD